MMKTPVRFLQCRMRSGRSKLALTLARPRVLDLVGHAVFPAAPARGHAVGRPFEHGLDLMQQPLLDLEQLGDFPGPRLLWPGSDGATIRRLEGARLAGRMIERRERQHDAALLIDDDIAAIANAIDE